MSPCCNKDLPDVIPLIFPCVLGPIPRLPLECIRSFLPPEHWPSPLGNRVGAWQTSNSYFSWEPLSGLQSFTHVQAHRFARLTGSTHPHNAAILPDCCRAAEAFTTTHITVGYLPRAVVMLAVQIRAIDGKGTPTPLDQQPCRPLLPGPVLTLAFPLWAFLSAAMLKCWRTYTPHTLSLHTNSSQLRGSACPGSESGDHPGTAKCPEPLCPHVGVTAFGGRPLGSPRRALPLLHRSY